MSAKTPVIAKKKLTPVIKETATPVVEKAKGKRDTVLVEYTPAELSAIVGPNTKIMVGRKSLNAIREQEVLVKAGLRK